MNTYFIPNNAIIELPKRMTDPYEHHRYDSAKGLHYVMPSVYTFSYLKLDYNRLPRHYKDNYMKDTTVPYRIISDYFVFMDCYTHPMDMTEFNNNTRNIHIGGMQYL